MGYSTSVVVLRCKERILSLLNILIFGLPLLHLKTVMTP